MMAEVDAIGLSCRSYSYFLVSQPAWVSSAVRKFRSLFTARCLTISFLTIRCQYICVLAIKLRRL
jgi:hypothetical protein